MCFLATLCRLCFPAFCMLKRLKNDMMMALFNAYCLYIQRKCVTLQPLCKKLESKESL